jgi:hypothetical protein
MGRGASAERSSKTGGGRKERRGKGREVEDEAAAEEALMCAWTMRRARTAPDIAPYHVRRVCPPNKVVSQSAVAGRVIPTYASGFIAFGSGETENARSR